MKSILITGAGARVGAHLARGLAAKGWAAAIHYNRSRDGAETLAAEITSDGGKAAVVQANLFVPQDVESLIGRASQILGAPLTALINNASTFENDSVDSFSNAQFDYHMECQFTRPAQAIATFRRAAPKRRIRRYYQYD